jgi:hypothetical protein
LIEGGQAFLEKVGHLSIFHLRFSDVFGFFFLNSLDGGRVRDIGDAWSNRNFYWRSHGCLTLPFL